MKIRIAIVTDTHASQADPVPSRRGAIADILLLRAIRRLNQWVKPDIVLFLGDMLDDGTGVGSAAQRESFKRVIGSLNCPYLIVPGNHDGDPDAFYRVFPRPPEYFDLLGFRFIAFCDPEEPGYNARRTPRDLERMRRARAGFDGPIVCVQHVPVFPPGLSDCPYNFTNAEEVISVMREQGIFLALAGHNHEGMELVRSGNVSFAASPAVCEEPFSFLEVNIDGETIRTTRHSLQMPRNLGLVDCHVHTQFAYCSENMEISRAMALARDFGLGGMGFAEHTGQLYFSADDFWSRRCFACGMAGARREHDRMEGYLRAVAEADCPPQSVGLEVDCDFEGRPLLRSEDRNRVRFLIGAIHALAEHQRGTCDPARASEAFLYRTRRLLESGVRVLAHPFRVFRRSDQPAPETLFEPLARMLRETGVAAELNFHTDAPPSEFIRLCLDAGVKFSLASDAHNLCEIGDFTPHLDLLRACGVSSPQDVLVDPRRLTSEG